MLKANEMSMTDIKLIKVANGIDAAATFKAGKVDAAVCWSPDDKDCVAAIQGSKILINTKKASNIIADAIYVKKSFLDSNQKAVDQLVKGWLQANADINSSEESATAATNLFATNFNVPAEVVDVHNARLCTYGDNVNFFEMNPKYAGCTGRSLYEEMSNEYGNIGLAESNLPYWREISDTTALRDLSDVLTGSEQAAEGKAKFTAVADASSLQTISTKKLSITFASGSAIVDQNAQYIIQMGFGNFIKSFARSRIRIEGNTDSVGSDGINQPLSERRAQAVANFLITTYKLDANRIVVVGNGSKKPVADNSTPDGRAQNRRTDFEIVE
jgi:NitT/TauT family transport system substrate-binding protein